MSTLTVPDDVQYRFLLHRIEDDKWPCLFDGAWIFKQRALDLVALYETQEGSES